MSMRPPGVPSVTKIDCSTSKDRTRQSMKDECDVNNIVARFKRTGVITHVARSNPVFADVSNVVDYRESVERVRRANLLFQSFPARVRSAFGNDPAAFLDAVVDESRQAELVALGVLRADVAAEVVPPVAPAADGGS